MFVSDANPDGTVGFRVLALHAWPDVLEVRVSDQDVFGGGFFPKLCEGERPDLCELDIAVAWASGPARIERASHSFVMQRFYSASVTLPFTKVTLRSL